MAKNSLIFFVIIFLTSLCKPTDVSSQSLSEENIHKINQYQVKAQENEAKGSLNIAAENYNKIAYVYWENDLTDKAIEYFGKSLTLNKKIGNENAIKVIQQNLAMLYTDKDDYPKAIELFKIALEYKQKMGKKKDACSILINIANSYVGMKQYDESNSFAEKALLIAKELSDSKLIRSCYGILAENYKQMGKDKKSFEYFSLFASFDKKIRSEHENEMQKRTAKAEAENMAKEKILTQQSKKLQKTEDSLKQQQMKIDLLNKDKELQRIKSQTQNEKRQKEQQLLIAIAIFTIIIAAIVSISLRNKKQAIEELEKQHKEIEKQNKEIKFHQKLAEETNTELEKSLDKIYQTNLKMSASLNYAVNIQKAILPDINKMKKYFPESFVYLKPKDIVSGDFYWYKKIQTSKNEKKFIIAAVDCTGHGVPGAFMSMIGINLLEEITNRNIHDADKILTELNLQIKQSLKQDVTENKDGMDMALCIINESKTKLTFSGANNPLIYIQDNEIKQIKGEKLPIGGFHKRKEKKYIAHTIDIDKPTWIYIFSDGFIDQFGGEKNRKFMIQNFRKLLFDIHQLPMEMQKDKLKASMKAWKGENRTQVDDILVLGLKIEPQA